MPDPIVPVPEPERVGKKITDRIDELERVVKALLKGLSQAEVEHGEPLMDPGSYYGRKFE